MRLVAVPFFASIAFAMMPLGSNSAVAQSLERQAAQIIRAHGYWCGRVANINPTFRGQTANYSTYRVFCDDGRENATYEMK